VAYHAFPPPSAIAHPETSAKLRKLGFGYRAEYIQKTAEMLLEAHGSDEGVFRWLETMRTMATGDARAELLKLMGVGRKVADCILLMSLDKTEVIPVDTHVHQIAIKHYGMRGTSGGKATMNPKLYDDVNAKLAMIWGKHSGWAHSVLFTADLKSFSSYGLPTPSPSASPEKRAMVKKTLITPSPSPRKRSRMNMVSVEETSSRGSFVNVSVKAEVDEIDESIGGNLIDRVKKRRRVVVSRSVLQKTDATEW